MLLKILYAEKSCLIPYYNNLMRWSIQGKQSKCKKRVCADGSSEEPKHEVETNSNVLRFVQGYNAALSINYPSSFHPWSQRSQRQVTLPYSFSVNSLKTVSSKGTFIYADGTQLPKVTAKKYKVFKAFKNIYISTLMCGLL